MEDDFVFEAEEAEYRCGVCGFLIMDEWSNECDECGSPVDRRMD